MRRIPRTPVIEEASRKGSMPMLMSRAKTPEVLPEWMVLMTKCPVSPACTAIWAVSASRISPIMMTWGSCRMSDRKATGYV